MTYEIQFTNTAVHDLKSLDRQTQKQVVKKIDSLKSNPLPLDSKKLRGTKEAYYRIRTGPYRIIYHIQQEMVIILIIRIRHRKEVYSNL